MLPRSQTSFKIIFGLEPVGLRQLTLEARDGTQITLGVDAEEVVHTLSWSSVSLASAGSDLPSVIPYKAVLQCLKSAPQYLEWSCGVDADTALVINFVEEPEYEDVLSFQVCDLRMLDFTLDKNGKVLDLQLN